MAIGRYAGMTLDDMLDGESLTVFQYMQFFIPNEAKTL